jgi:DnaJ-class molecular chaperone
MIDRKIPSSVVYEDENVLAILDISQVTKGHTLVMPKKHFRNIIEADEETVLQCVSTAKKLAAQIVRNTGAAGVNVLTNCGEAAGLEGDLIVTVHVKKDKKFTREGDHIYMEQQVSFPQAALGDVLSIPTIEGKEVEFKIAPGTQSGTVFKLRGQGMNSVRHKGRGNMYVTVNVVVPKKLNSKQKDLLKQFAEISGDEIKQVKRGLFDRVKDAME